MTAAAKPGRGGQAAGEPPRRRLLRRLWALLGLAAVAEAAWVVVSFVRPRRGAAERDAGLVIAGPVDRFEPGSVSAFPAGQFYLVRLKDGGFLALHRECTHLGCTVPWVASEDRFHCPCHGSIFFENGVKESGPAPRPLDYFPITVTPTGDVQVNTGKPTSRSDFNPSQTVAYP